MSFDKELKITLKSLVNSAHSKYFVMKKKFLGN